MLAIGRMMIDWFMTETKIENGCPEHALAHKQVMEEIKLAEMTYAWTAEQSLEKEYLLKSLREKARNIRLEAYVSKYGQTKY